MTIIINDIIIKEIKIKLYKKNKEIVLKYK